MNPAALMKTVYLGDRACRALTINGWAKEIRIHVDCISRMRPSTETWDYYVDEDITEGVLVFADVDQLNIEVSGPLPNDEIEVVTSEPGVGQTATTVSIGAVDQDGVSHEFLLRFLCRDAWLEDPKSPGVELE